jgi:hypothetical protein
MPIQKPSSGFEHSEAIDENGGSLFVNGTQCSPELRNEKS